MSSVTALRRADEELSLHLCRALAGSELAEVAVQSNVGPEMRRLLAVSGPSMPVDDDRQLVTAVTLGSVVSGVIYAVRVDGLISEGPEPTRLGPVWSVEAWSLEAWSLSPGVDSQRTYLSGLALELIHYTFNEAMLRYPAVACLWRGVSEAGALTTLLARAEFQHVIEDTWIRIVRRVPSAPPNVPR